MIRSLADEDLIRFGGHTTRHSILAKLPEPNAAVTYVDDVEAVAALTGRKCSTFAYPNGRTSDYRDSDVDALRECGVELAVTTQSGPSLPGDDPLRIRRCGIGNSDGLPQIARMGHHLRWLLTPETTGGHSEHACSPDRSRNSVR